MLIHEAVFRAELHQLGHDARIIVLLPHRDLFHDVGLALSNGRFLSFRWQSLEALKHGLSFGRLGAAHHHNLVLRHFNTLVRPESRKQIRSGRRVDLVALPVDEEARVVLGHGRILLGGGRARRLLLHRRKMFCMLVLP